MAYDRRFQATALATTVFLASGAGASQLLAGPNPARGQLSLQGEDSFYFSPNPSVTASTGLRAPSGAIVAESYHTGPVYGSSAAANGATVAIHVWESSYAGA